MLRALAGIAVLVFLVCSVGACQLGGPVALKVGDCINYEPSEDGENTVKVDCSQPHAEEVFSVFAYPNPGATFPGYEAIGAAQQPRCQADFTGYVGISWEHSAYGIGFTGPTEQTWASGDRAIACTLDDANGGNLTGSAKDTAR